jgi:hypothetical protein
MLPVQFLKLRVKTHAKQQCRCGCTKYQEKDHHGATSEVLPHWQLTSSSG